MQFIDITREYSTTKKYKLKKKNYFIDDMGIKYTVDNKYVILDPTEKEIAVAKLMGKTIGGNVSIIPRINEPEGIKTPDYIINNEKFDLKEIRGNGKNSLYDSLGKQRKQANNFIFNISASEIDEAEAVRQIKNIYYSKHRRWVHKLILIENGKILKIFKRD